jgi:hypothetical protein
MTKIKNALIAAVAAAALITPAIASAQDASYADGGNQQIQGTVAAINGTWNISVHDANGYTDSVQLEQGTIINPTGLTLEPGMNVTIDGYADGPNFDALEIDTPYQYQGPAPVAVYYGPGDWYPGYANGWGPSFSLSFDIGTRNFVRHSYYVGGQYRRPLAPPSGWQDRPHGYVGNGGFARTAYTAPQQSRAFAAPQQPRNFAPPPQQARSFAPPPQQSRNFAAPPQQSRSFAPPPQQSRNFAAPPQQARSFAAPPQQPRTFAPQQARSFAAPAPRAAGAPGPRGGEYNGRQRG